MSATSGNKPSVVCAELGKRSFGVFTREAALGAGVSRNQLSYLVRHGELRRLRPGVLAVSAMPSVWEQWVIAAQRWLGPTWVASGRSAARIWGLDGCESSYIELTGTSKRPTDAPGLILHRTQFLPHGHRTSRNGIPLTSPARTLLDLGRDLSCDELELALESAIRSRLVTVPYLLRQLDMSRGHLRSGLRLLDRLLKDRGDLEPTDSALETKLFAVLRRGDVPLPQRQIPVYEDGRFLGRPDFIYPNHRVVIEAQSYRHHFDPAAIDRDIARRERFEAAGYQVVEVTYRQLTRYPDDVCRRVKDALMSQSR